MTSPAADKEANAQETVQPAFPFLDLGAQFSSIRDEVMAAVTRVLESQQFILGEARR
jgi:hypothetical protein